MKIIRTRRYAKDLKRLRVTAAEAAAIEQAIADTPTAGDVVPGLRGLRKLRFALAGKGKRGGGRAIYVLLVGDDMAVMLTAYAKAEQTDLSPAQRRAILTMLEEIKKNG